MHHSLFQITDKTELAASSSSCLLDVLAVMDFTLELWARIIPFALKLFLSEHYYHSNRKETKTLSIWNLPLSSHQLLSASKELRLLPGTSAQTTCYSFFTEAKALILSYCNYFRKFVSLIMLICLISTLLTPRALNHFKTQWLRFFKSLWFGSCYVEHQSSINMVEWFKAVEELECLSLFQIIINLSALCFQHLPPLIWKSGPR